ncbi:Baeyer-Villiger monooxygenase [Pseudolycoriella hygida]|uniref:Flavin-containing monooxygenase n=1 Tax=Pseudolycoriella hygida TaxID=35572 RepID=A0A9Q0S7Z3_9DIPT|nr:Baeyer-Villiger monooxygenase [Pseudolycoriella hygida]
MVKVEQLDVLVVGAGFSGLHFLQKLRKLNFNVKICEATSGIGGTWYIHRYPGARVDSDFPFYQFTQDDIWKGFQWTERFPGQQELEQYFEHVDRKLNLKKDIMFNTRVTSAQFCSSTNQWLVKTNNSEEITVRAKFIMLCVGFADRKYTPKFKGVDEFKGIVLHTSVWPKSDIDVVGKRVAVIGTGASGVQTIQEIAPKVDHLTVYQRTPNLALPMQQSSLLDQTNWKFPTPDQFQEIFDSTRSTFSGLDFNFIPLNGSGATHEQREAYFEECFRRGGFYFWIGNYQDIFTNAEVNDAAYQFWCKKTRSRINDPVKKEILAPTIAPHPFGTKRPSLEQRYYEVYNQSNVDIINVRKSPIIEVTEKGIKTEVEGEIEFDVIIFATGYDAQTGAILNVEIKNEFNESIEDKWRNGVLTNFGLSIASFPNIFFTYGPQAPTALSNGPACIEIQADWIIELLVKMRQDHKTKIVATEEAEAKWKEIVNGIWEKTLFPLADSWYQGANIPGKRRETLNFAGGIPMYISFLKDCSSDNYKGFEMS